MNTRAYHNSWMDVGMTKWDVLKSAAKSKIDEATRAAQCHKSGREKDDYLYHYWLGAESTARQIYNEIKELEQEERELTEMKRITEEDKEDEA